MPTPVPSQYALASFEVDDRVMMRDPQLREEYGVGTVVAKTHSHIHVSFKSLHFNRWAHTSKSKDVIPLGPFDIISAEKAPTWYTTRDEFLNRGPRKEARGLSESLMDSSLAPGKEFNKPSHFPHRFGSGGPPPGSRGNRSGRGKGSPRRGRSNPPSKHDMSTTGYPMYDPNPPTSPELKKRPAWKHPGVNPMLKAPDQPRPFSPPPRRKASPPNNYYNHYHRNQQPAQNYSQPADHLHEPSAQGAWQDQRWNPNRHIDQGRYTARRTGYQGGGGGGGGDFDDPPQQPEEEEEGEGGDRQAAPWMPGGAGNADQISSPTHSSLDRGEEGYREGEVAKPHSSSASSSHQHHLAHRAPHLWEGWGEVGTSESSQDARGGKRRG